MTATTEGQGDLRIGEVAYRVGVNPKTIRYYEDIGLIPEPVRRPSGYRSYGPEDIDRITFIRRAQRFGLSLDEIREVLGYRQHAQRPCDFVLAAVRRHGAEIDQRIAALTQVRTELGDLIDRAADDTDAPVRYCHLLEPTQGPPVR